ncbi:MAG: hypothetical protein P4L83_20230 [Nevskia sp.]|nr:hypothetical protein [Nevskia sp.]
MEANVIEIDPSEHGVQVKGTIAGGKAKYFIKFHAPASQLWLHHVPHRHDLHVNRDGILIDCIPSDLQEAYDEIKAIIDLVNKHCKAHVDDYNEAHGHLHAKARHARENAEHAVRNLKR